MTLTQALARFGLFAEATPAGAKITGPVKIGNGSLEKEWSDADIAYAFKVVAAADDNVATLTLSSGAVAQTTGLPVITNGAGEDFEGVTLPTMVNLLAIQIRAKGTEGYVQVASSLARVPDVDELENGNTVVFESDAGEAVGAGTVAFTFEAATDWVEVVVIGRST